MDLAALKAMLDDELFDNHLMFHGFTNYIRDYELVVFQSVDPRSGLVPRHIRFLFRYCPEVEVRSRVTPDGWARSLDDRLLVTHNVTRDTQGYVWGTQSQELYPGATIIEDSQRARDWEEQVGIPFHEVHIEANAQEIHLVFSEVSVEEVAGLCPIRGWKTRLP